MTICDKISQKPLAERGTGEKCTQAMPCASVSTFFDCNEVLVKDLELEKDIANSYERGLIIKNVPRETK